MSKLSEEIKKRTPPRAKATRDNPHIIPKHRAIFERMKQGEKISGAMIALSYKPSSARVPAMLTKSKSWQALMDEQLPEDHIALRHRELLDARKYRYVTKGRGKNRREERIDDGADPIVMRAVELGYKLRNRVAGEAPPAERANVYNLFFNPTVQQNVRTFEDALKKTIAYEVDRPVIEQVRTDARDPEPERSDAGAVAETREPEGDERSG